jgi:hypothetical protein
MVLLIPIFALGGALVGAATAETTVTTYTLPEYQQVSGELAEFVVNLDPGAIFSERFLIESTANSKHSLRSGISDAVIALPRQDAVIEFNLQIAFIGDSTEDTDLALKVIAASRVSFPSPDGEIGELKIPSLRYVSDEHELSEWTREGFALLQSELEEAAEVVSRELAQALFSQPTHSIRWISKLELERMLERELERERERQRQAQREKWKRRHQDWNDVWEDLLAEAERGSVVAQTSLGRHYYGAATETGAQLPPDRAEAAWYWACLAANAGHPPAQYLLGNWLSRLGHQHADLHVPVDYIRAYVWYGLAAANGPAYDTSARSILADKLSLKEVGEARLLLADWKPDPTGCEATLSAISYVDADDMSYDALPADFDAPGPQQALVQPLPDAAEARTRVAAHEIVGHRPTEEAVAAQTPVRSIDRVDAYLAANRAAVREQLEQHYTKHRPLVGSVRYRKRVSEVSSIEVKDIQGSRVFLNVTFHLGQGQYAGTESERYLFELEWQGDTLEIVGHRPAEEATAAAAADKAEADEPPIRSIGQVNAYLAVNRAAIREQLDAYNRKHRVVPNSRGPTGMTSEISDIGVEDVYGNRVLANVTYRVKRRANYSVGTPPIDATVQRLFVLEWQGDTLEIVGHRPADE